MSNLYAIVESNKTVSTTTLDIYFQSDITLANQASTGHEYNMTLDSITDALVITGPSRKTQKATITLSGTPTTGNLHVVFNGFQFAIATTIGEALSTIATRLAGAIAVATTNFGDVSATGAVVSVTYVGTDITRDIFVNNSNSHFDGDTSGLSAAIATVDTWLDKNGDKAAPSAFATPGNPLYDTTGITIGVNFNDQSAGKTDIAEGLNAWYSALTGGANLTIRAEGFSTDLTSAGLVQIHQTDATAMNAVEVNETGSFSINFSEVDRVDALWSVFTDVQDIIWDSHTNVYTAKYDLSGTLTIIPHSAGHTLSIRQYTSISLGNGEPIFEPYTKA